MNPKGETLEIRTADGRGLGATLAEPGERTAAGTAILAHPMFANRSVFDRPRGSGVATLLLEAGWRTLAFDFRGHGESTYRGRRATARDDPWTYDDLVQKDVPAVVQAARARWPESRLVVVGHSLGGHVALASASAGHVDVDGLVLAASNVWMAHLEPSAARWWAKVASVRAMRRVARRQGYFPVRAMRLGTDDEALPYVEDFTRFALTGRWTSRDGTVDYERGLARLDVPTFALTSAGDTMSCRPECAARLVADLPRCTHHCVLRMDDGGPPPGHMALLTHGASRSGWARVVRWLREGR